VHPASPHWLQETLGKVQESSSTHSVKGRCKSCLIQVLEENLFLARMINFIVISITKKDIHYIVS
jgi:hypothetical protein